MFRVEGSGKRVVGDVCVGVCGRGYCACWCVFSLSPIFRRLEYGIRLLLYLVSFIGLSPVIVRTVASVVLGLAFACRARHLSLWPNRSGAMPLLPC